MADKVQEAIEMPDAHAVESKPPQQTKVGNNSGGHTPARVSTPDFYSSLNKMAVLEERRAQGLQTPRKKRKPAARKEKALSKKPKPEEQHAATERPDAQAVESEQPQQTKGGNNSGDRPPTSIASFSHIGFFSGSNPGFPTSQQSQEEAQKLTKDLMNAKRARYN
jgi:hypothetical protein